MILYHGSYIKIEKPSLEFSRDELDFGKGFYLTSYESQAELWAKRYKKTKGKVVVNIYELDEEVYKNYKVLRFDGYTRDWLQFVSDCRKGIKNDNYEIVYGCIANDRVFNTTELYFKGLIDIDTAIERLKYEKQNNQICIKKQSIIDKDLHFREAKNYAS